MLEENKKQTMLIEKQTDKIDSLHEILIDHDGRLTGKDVKNSKLLMLYKEPSYVGYNINDKDTYILPLRILRRQINNMRQPAKSIYEHKEYLFATNLPEAINQNSSILNNIIDNEDIGIYFELENKGDKTKLNIDVNRFLHDYYRDKLQNIKQKRINNKINELVNKFIRYYKIKLNDETKIKLFKDFSDDEGIDED